MTLFVTGTDTGVGKTHTIARLLEILRASGVAAVGFKPICCGDRRDAEELLAASSDGVTLDEVNPVWLKAPLAPLPAAQLERRKIDIDQVVRAFDGLRRRFEAVIVEGVGGWLVPIRSDYFVRDLALALKSPVLIVALNRLGCLNHTLLTARSVRDSGLRCAGVVLNELPGQDDLAKSTNPEVLRTVLEVPLLGGLAPQGAELPPGWAQALGVGSTL